VSTNKKHTRLGVFGVLLPECELQSNNSYKKIRRYCEVKIFGNYINVSKLNSRRDQNQGWLVLMTLHVSYFNHSAI
jgi:hypothetical protein